MSYRYGNWKPYVPVSARRAKADKAVGKLSRKGEALHPVRLAGRKIAESFWGKAWCQHLEKFSDFENRLPRGRSYVRSNAVCHLEIKPGRVEARVMGSSLYTVSVDIRRLAPARWGELKQKCVGEIGSLLQLLQGRLSEPVMRMVTDRDHGLFPKPGEMSFDCSCPDWANMCKHVAATLYGVGNRLDQEPELLFRLRQVDAQELVDAGVTLTQQAPAAAADPTLTGADLGAIFGIDLAPVAEPGVARQVPARKAPKTRSRARTFVPTAKSIRALRRKLGLSVDEFAARLSVSPASVVRWEAATGGLKLQARCQAALEALRHS